MNKKTVVSNLYRLGQRLDKKGFKVEANLCDKILKSFASSSVQVRRSAQATVTWNIANNEAKIADLGEWFIDDNEQYSGDDCGEIIVNGQAYLLGDEDGVRQAIGAMKQNGLDADEMLLAFKTINAFYSLNNIANNKEAFVQLVESL